MHIIKYTIDNLIVKEKDSSLLCTTKINHHSVLFCMVVPHNAVMNDIDCFSNALLVLVAQRCLRSTIQHLTLELFITNHQFSQLLGNFTLFFL